MDSFQGEGFMMLLSTIVFSIMLTIVLTIIVPNYNDIMIGILETVAMY